MNIRRAEISDLDKLAVLGAATFANSFGHLYRPEDMQIFIDDAHSVDRYREALNSEDKPIWVVDNDSELVGFIKLCPNSLPCDPPLSNATEISKIYFHAAYQGRGLGAKLIEEATIWAQGLGYTNMVLSVYSENHDGQRFYARHGFEKIGEYLFPVGKQLDQEFIFRKKL